MELGRELIINQLPDQAVHSFLKELNDTGAANLLLIVRSTFTPEELEKATQTLYHCCRGHRPLRMRQRSQLHC